MRIGRWLVPWVASAFAVACGTPPPPEPVAPPATQAPAPAVFDADEPIGTWGFDRVPYECDVRVVSARDGRPVPGTRVRVVVRGPHGRDGDETREVATTDAEGRATLPVGRSCWFLARGFVPARDMASPGRDVALVPGRAVTITVTEAATGRPCTAARVRVFGTDDHGRADTRRDLGIELTPDSDGLVHVAVPEGERTAVVARAPGVAPVAATLDPVAGRVAADLVLGGGGRVTGLVRDETGEPLAGAAALVVPADAGEHDPRRYAWVPTDASSRFVLPLVVTDDHGRFEIAGVPLPGRWVVVAARALDATGRSQAISLDADHAEAACDVRLERTAMLRIRVIGPDGTAPEKPWITVNVPWGSDTASAEDTPAGREWTYGPLLAGDVTVTVNAPGLVGERRVVHVAADGPDAAVTAEFHLAAGRSLTGVVTSTSGAPVAGADVRWGGPGTEHYVKTSADGSFTIDGLPDAAGTLQVMNPPGHRWYLARNVTPNAAPLRIVLEPLSGIRGRLQPVPASRHVWYEGPGVSSRRTADVADDGTFEFHGIDGGRAGDLVLWPVGRPCHIVRGVRLAPGETKDLGVIDASPDAAVTGVVTGAFGRDDDRPLAGATVYADQFPVAADLRTRTDSDGRFTLPLHRASRATVVVSADGFATVFVAYPGAASAEPLALRLTPGGTVTGCLTRADGAPAADDAYVEFLRADRAPGRWVATAQRGLGRFEIRLPPGRYTSRAWIDRGRVAGPVVDVVEGGASEVSIVGKAR